MMRLAVWMLLAAAPVAAANPVPVGSPGTTILPLKGARLTPTNAVQLVSETIDISDDASVSLPAFSPHEKEMKVDAASYRCRYRLKNVTKKNVAFVVGFPVVTYGYNAGGSIGGVEDFAVSANGKNIPTKQTDVSMPNLIARSELGPGIAEELLKAKSAKEVPAAPEYLDLTPAAFKKVAAKDQDFTPIQQTLVWYSFPVTFKAGEAIDLAINYKSILPLSPVRFGYILRTGKFWHGKVEEVTLNFTPKKNSKAKYQATPANKLAPTKDGGFTMQLKQIEPDFDVSFERKD